MPEVAPAGGGRPTTSICSTPPVGAHTADGPIEHVQRMTDRASRAAALPGWLRDLVPPVAGPAGYRVPGP